MNINASPKYTKKDMKILDEMSTQNAPIKFILKKVNYDPKQLKEYLIKRKLKKDIEYLFEIPISEIPLRLKDSNMSGYLTFRMTLGK